MTTIDGAISGIDTSSLIRAILDASSGPKRAVEARAKQYETKNTKITDQPNNVIRDLWDFMNDEKTQKGKLIREKELGNFERKSKSHFWYNC